MSLHKLARGRWVAIAIPAIPTPHREGSEGVSIMRKRIAEVAIATEGHSEIETKSISSSNNSSFVLQIDAAVLGDRVLFGGDGYRAAPEDPIAYRADELVALIGKPPEMMRAVHAMKKAFPGAAVAIGSRPYGRRS